MASRNRDPDDDRSHSSADPAHRGVALQSARVLNNRAQHSLNNDLIEEVPEYTNAADHRSAGQSLTEFTVSYLQGHLRPQGLVLIIALSRAGTTSTSIPGSVFATPDAARLRSTPKIDALLRKPPSHSVIFDLTIEHTAMRVMASPIRRGDHVEGTLIAASNLTTLNNDLHSQMMLVTAEGVAALLAAVLGGYLLIRRVLRVIVTVTDTAEEITGGDLSRRLHYQGPNDEVGRLARTVDGMLDRLDTAFSSQRQLLADVSHQLRTPLTVIRGHLDILNRGAIGSEEAAASITMVIDELDQLSLMIDRMLLLGQALEHDFLLEETFSLPALLSDVFDAAVFLADRDWQLGAVPAVIVRADRTKLRSALLNLLDNAVKATHTGQRISLSAIADVDADLVIAVTDTGRGLDPSERDAVMARFGRSDTPRYRGSGLGLAIVKAVAAAHNGHLELDSARGRGCTVRIVLPATRIQPASTTAGAQ